MLRVEGNETEDLFYVFHLDWTTSYTVCLLRSVVPNLGAALLQIGREKSLFTWKTVFLQEATSERKDLKRSSCLC